MSHTQRYCTVPVEEYDNINMAQVAATYGREVVLDSGFSLADIMLTTCLTWADNYGATLQPISNAYVKRMTSREGFIRARNINHPR